MPDQKKPAIDKFDFDKYIARTEAAVRPQFDLMHKFNEETRAPPLRTDENGIVIDPYGELAEYVDRVQKNHNHHFAKSIVCGTILQVAYVAIKEYSQNEITPGEYDEYSVTPGSNAAKYCIGRLVHGIPLGLLVFGARNQFNHWEEGDPTSAVTRAVFEKLYLHYRHDMMSDLVYALSWPWYRPVTHFVLWDEMGWRSYDIYLEDMCAMLK